MRDKGCDVDIISFEDAEIKGVNVHYIKPLKREISTNSADSKSLSYMVKAHKVKKLLNVIKPDIVHAHYATGYGLTGALCGIKPYIISTWGSDIFIAPKKNILLKYILKFNLSKADFITATSQNLTRETSLYTDKKVKTIPFGVDTTKFSTHKRNMSNRITLGIVKSLEEIYGIKYLIEAFAKIAFKYMNTELLIVGDGPLESELKTMCKKLNIEDRVIFAGKIPNSKIPDMLSSIDIFVMPSLSESFGVSILEAEACGLPVVATNVGGIPEVVRDSETGFLVAPGDSNAIAEKLCLLVEDGKMREKFGAYGRKFVELNYDWKDSVEKMYELYSSILRK